MTGYGKHGKPQRRLSTLPTPLGNPVGITTFPQLRRRREYVSGPANPAENPRPEPLSTQGVVNHVSGLKRKGCPGTLSLTPALRASVSGLLCGFVIGPDITAGICD